MVFVELVPNLYLGDKYAPRERDFDVVVNCTTNIEFHPSTNSSSVTQIRVPVEDNGNQEEVAKLRQLIWDVIPEVYNAIVNENKTVLIHCNMGRQRSCALAAAYLMYTLRINRDAAIAYIKEKKRDAFFPAVNFYDALWLPDFTK